jgi:hypothetical protein
MASRLNLPDLKQIVAAGGDGDHSFGHFLAADIGEVVVALEANFEQFFQSRLPCINIC